MDNSKELEQGNIKDLLFKFSLPAIVGMMVNALYNIVDTIYIGHMKGTGSTALSGIAITFPLSTIIMAFGMLVGVGSSSLISIRLGQKRKEDAEKILSNAFVLDIIISSAVGILGYIFVEPTLKLFGAKGDVLIYAKSYISIILLGAPLQNIGFGMNNVIRAEGNPNRAMITMLSGAILNIILDPIFIFVFNMGVEGAAIATVISEALNTFLVVSYFASSKSHLHIKKDYLKPNAPIIKDIFAIGMSPFFMQIASSAVTTFYNQGLLTYGGDKAVAAMSIINKISMLIFMPIYGINQGSQPIIGFNYGSKKYDRVKKTLGLAIKAADIIACIGFVMVEFFPSILIKLFNTEDTELIAIAVRGIRIDLMFLPIIAFQIISSNYFQAIGKAKISMFLSVLRQVIILIPLILILPRFFGLNGLWFSAPVSDIVSAVITAIFLIRNIKSLPSM
ncbi:MAG TPA: MATE family efflux transporter [Clostridiaceae bacterium]|jgi:putative MATE family efflux protein|nr:MATE family efflux transporter [Clostridiaceae bacterium]HBN28057.1 MATE family efflux transporter [Clostridiaceae bacterium]HBX49383.1 MATE family efflux transporter [Clostridiaceae bacterium]HCL49933.1 MATE family efflux transporter [Clostridiaceae bacterium]